MDFDFSTLFCDLFFWCFFFHVVCKILNFKDVNLKAFGTSFLYWKLILLQLQKDLVPFLASYRFRHTCRMQRYKIDSWKYEPFSIMCFIKDFSIYSKVGYCHSDQLFIGAKIICSWISKFKAKLCQVDDFFNNHSHVYLLAVNCLPMKIVHAAGPLLSFFLMSIKVS